MLLNKNTLSDTFKTFFAASLTIYKDNIPNKTANFTMLDAVKEHFFGMINGVYFQTMEKN